MKIDISLSRKPTDNVTVSWATQDDTAIAGVDYIAGAGSLEFGPGEDFKSIEIDTIERDTRNKRKFFVVLSAPVNAIISDGTGTCSIVPVIVNGPLVKSSLITNAYNNELGRGGYFHSNSGTSEGQSVAIEGALRASRVVGDPDASDWFKMLGTSLLYGIGSGSRNGPILRQPFPTSADTITLLHWLFAAKGDIPGQGATYDYVGAVSNGVITIPRADIFNVWMIYPTDAALLYENPFSPAYDASGNEVEVKIADWSIENGQTVITIPSTAPDKAQWKVVFGYYRGVIKQGEALEAYPFWVPIADGYSACAPDTFRWFDIAITEGMKVQNDARWGKLRAALRKSAVRGQAITDLREVLKPISGMPVFPPSGQQPDGMYCYSTHKQATSGRGGAGTNFWSRDGAGNIVGVVPAGNMPVQTQIGRGFNDEWRLANSFQDADSYLWLSMSLSSKLESNGYKQAKSIDIVIKKTASGFELKGLGKTVDAKVIEGSLLDGLYGTGEPFVSGAADKDGKYGHFVIQTAGYCQFTVDEANADVAALTVGKTLTETLAYQVEYTGEIYVYVSSSKQYDANKRWYANLKTVDGWDGIVTAFTAGKQVDFYIPASAFKLRDADNSTLAPGTRFENFGVSIEHPGGYTAKIGWMRMVKDKTADAKNGSKMPYFPGAMPFAINADTVAQQFVGWNGSPFHGYQLPDYWFELSAEADAVHPNLKLSDLTVVDPDTGVVITPITATSSDGKEKPKAALLMEQQLLFLKHAQRQWQSDGGQFGPFAHTFVLNTAARMSLGNPTPNTWVYTNDDPNTRWAGYQARVVESLARLTWVSRFGPGWKTSRDMAGQMASDWLTWLNGYWPNLNGTIRGMPTDFPDPRVSLPQTLYEEPHSPAIIMRACIFMKLSGHGNVAMLDALIMRCWNYVESCWVTQGPMRYTWSPLPDAGEWFGFWHFEIVTSISVMLDEGKPVRPAGITESVLRERLRLTAQWLRETGVE